MSNDPIQFDFPTEDSRGRPLRQVVLVKGGQRYVFRYAPGEEAQLLHGLAEMAQDPKCDLTWFDAAVLSHQMGQGISQQLEKILKT